MHFVLGSIIVVASFVLALGDGLPEFDGFVSVPAAILLLGVPLGLTIATNPFSTLDESLRGVMASVTRDLVGEQKRTKKRLAALARSVRQGRGQAAHEALQGSRDRIFVALAERVIRQASGDDIRRDGTTMAADELAKYQAAERVFGNLGDYAPGVGMMGTVVGLIQLLANLGDLSSLGPGMALALITTLYGLVLAHVLYLPLSRMAAAQGIRRAADLNLILTCLTKIAARDPVIEVEQLIGERIGIAKTDSTYATEPS